MLDPAPILRVIYLYLDDGGTVRELERVSRVPEKSIRRLMTGESRHVRIDVADRLALAFGLHLDLVYDEAAA